MSKKVKNSKKSIIIPLSIVLIIIGIIYISVISYLSYGIRIKDKNDTTYKIVEIEKGNKAKEVCEILEKEGIIRNDTCFYIKMFSTGIHGKIGSGKYELSPSMSASEIIEVLSSGGIKEESTTTITIVEGSTVEDIANQLFDSGIIYDKQIFLDLCKTGKGFEKNKALSDVSFKNKDDKYVLEGYLFPDTYEFYLNSSASQVITKMLDRFNEIYNDTYETRAEELGYSKSEIITIASIIEKESITADFNKVSSVLYNRLESDMMLQVDSTIRYINNQNNSILLTQDQYKDISEYNTYKTYGLPPSAICSPSQNAILAALYPDQEYINEKYLYFCLTNIEEGKTIFSKTYSEHLTNVKKYKENWEAYDSAIE